MKTLRKCFLQNTFLVDTSAFLETHVATFAIASNAIKQNTMFISCYFMMCFNCSNFSIFWTLLWRVYQRHSTTLHTVNLQYWPLTKYNRNLIVLSYFPLVRNNNEFQCFTTRTSFGSFLVVAVLPYLRQVYIVYIRLLVSCRRLFAFENYSSLLEDTHIVIQFS